VSREDYCELVADRLICCRVSLTISTQTFARRLAELQGFMVLHGLELPGTTDSQQAAMINSLIRFLKRRRMLTHVLDDQTLLIKKLLSTQYMHEGA